MTQATPSERVAPWDEWAPAASGAGYALNIVFVYQDSQTRKWAKEVYERVAKIAGQETARATWWRMSDLSEPGVLAGAVSTAMRADVIVVAVRTGEGLPLPFYVWVNAWLPHRGPQMGALVALLGGGTDRSLHRARVRDYLQMVARQSKLDFLPEERELPDDGEDWSSAAQGNEKRPQHFLAASPEP
jgi:hypothetical protein